MDLNKQLAAAYGDLARGYKKLRELHLRGVKIPAPKSESDDEPAEVGSLGELDVTELMGDKNIWSENRTAFIQKFLEATLGTEVVRMDRYKNAWRYNNSRKSGWEKIGATQVQKKFFEPLAHFMEDVETFLSRISDPKEMALAFPRLKNHRGKWHRIQKILPGLRLQEKEFRAYLTNVHESLPSFR